MVFLHVTTETSHYVKRANSSATSVRVWCYVSAGCKASDPDHLLILAVIVQVFGMHNQGKKIKNKNYLEQILTL